MAIHADAGAIRNALCDTFFRIPVNQLPLATVLQTFEDDRGMASCGLSANMMVKILLDNGIDAYTYNFGFANTHLTHVMVLVKHANDLLIFDPHMNYELRDNEGKNMGLFRLLSQLATNGPAPVFYGDTVLSDMIFDLSILTQNEWAILQQPAYRMLVARADTIRPAIIKAVYGKCFNCASNPASVALVAGLTSKLAEQTTLPVAFYHTFALKISLLSGAADEEEMNARVDAAIAAAALPYL